MARFSSRRPTSMSPVTVLHWEYYGVWPNTFVVTHVTTDLAHGGLQLHLIAISDISSFCSFRVNLDENLVLATHRWLYKRNSNRQVRASPFSVHRDLRCDHMQVPTTGVLRFFPDRKHELRTISAGLLRDPVRLLL